MIHRIRIQNFRSLRDVTVELDPVTVLIGKSGTGKSNFVAAIRFLRDYLEQGPQGEAARKSAVHRCATNPSGRIEFEVEFDVPGFSDRFVYAIGFHEQHVTHSLRFESLRHGESVIFRQVRKERSGLHGSGLQWEKAPPLVSPPEPGPLALGHLPGLEEVVIAYAALTAGMGVYVFPYGVLTNPGRANAISGLADDAGNYLQVLKVITSSLHDIATRRGIAAALRQINPTIVGIELDSIQNPQSAVVAHKRGDKTLPIELREESEGFRRFYAHLLTLYQTPSKQTLIFEEPENGIYPGALGILAEEFEAAPGAGRGQVLLTTHNPTLLDHFSAEQIRVVELVDLETRIGRLAEEQKQSLAEELLHAGELLTVDPARSEHP